MDGQETEFLLRAFQHDFETNGPSVVRAVWTTLKGYRKHKDHPNPRIRKRFRREAKDLVKHGVPMVAASKLYYQDNPALCQRMDQLLSELIDEFGADAEHFAKVAAPFVLEKIRAEEKRLAEGWTYEPPTFYEKNAACQKREQLASTAK